MENKKLDARLLNACVELSDFFGVERPNDEIVRNKRAFLQWFFEISEYAPLDCFEEFLVTKEPTNEPKSQFMQVIEKIVVLRRNERELEQERS